MRRVHVELTDAAGARWTRNARYADGDDAEYRVTDDAVSFRVVAQKPREDRPMSASRFDTKSTMQESYQAHSSVRQPSCRPNSAYAGPTPWMQPVSTTHRDAFKEWSVPKRKPFTPKRTTHTDDSVSMTGR